MRRIKGFIAIVLLICIFTSSASAATVRANNTAEVNYDALDLLYSLNIIDQEIYNNFDPNGYLTRAQVAKMVYITIKAGDDDDAVNFKGDSNTFTDVNKHWAEGYINYTFATKYLVGYGDGTFRPNNNMTGYGFFKIILAVIGYDTQIEGFEGERWDHRVIQRAMESGLLANYHGEPNKNITRGDAVEILQNMLNAKMVEYTNKGQLKQTNKTVADDVFHLRLSQGILMANDIAGLGVEPIKKASTSWIDTNNNGTLEDTELFPAPTDINLIGFHVTVVQNTKINKVYNIFKTRGLNNILTVTPNTSERLKSKDARYFLNFTELPEEKEDNKAINKIADSTYTQYIDNNGDGKYDLVLSTNYRYATVTSVKFPPVTTDVEFKLSDGTTLTPNKYTGLANLTVGTRVIYLKASSAMSKGVVKKIEPTEGKITSFNNKTMAFNHTEYTYSNIDGAVDKRPGLNIRDEYIGKSAKSYTFNGDVLEIEPITPRNARQRYAYFLDFTIKDTLNPWIEKETYDRTYIAKVVFDDGATGTYQIGSVEGKTLSNDSKVDNTPKKGLYSFTINSFGTIDITTYSFN